MAYAYKATLTVTSNSALLPATQSAFPVLVSGTFDGTAGIPNLKTVGNSGHIQNTVTLNGQSVPADLIFTSDSAGTSPLSWEVESYTASTGVIAVWVNVSSLSLGLVFYMFYGDAAITTYQCTASATWDSNYKVVMHQQATSTTSDSTGVITLATTGSSNAVGQIGGAISYAGGTDKTTLTYNSAWAGAISGACTVQLWYRTGTLTSYEAIVDTANRNFGMFVNGGASNAFYGGIGGSASFIGPIISGLDTTGVWKSLYMRRSGTGASQADIILDNVKSTQTLPGTTNNSNNITLGSNSSGGGSNYQGRVDEFRISTVARSDNWITAEYNNQLNPSTFIAVGAETAVGGGHIILAQCYSRWSW